MNERKPTRDDAARAITLAESLGRKLRGNNPGVMGGALADTVAKWLAGHHPSIREQILNDWLEAMRELIAPNEKIILDHYGGVWPDKMEDWREKTP